MVIKSLIYKFEPMVPWPSDRAHLASHTPCDSRLERLQRRVAFNNDRRSFVLVRIIRFFDLKLHKPACQHVIVFFFQRLIYAEHKYAFMYKMWVGMVTLNLSAIGMHRSKYLVYMSITVAKRKAIRMVRDLQITSDVTTYVYNIIGLRYLHTSYL